MKNISHQKSRTSRVCFFKKITFLGLFLVSLGAMAKDNDTIINHYLNRKRAERKEAVEKNKEIVNSKPKYFSASTGTFENNAGITIKDGDSYYKTGKFSDGMEKYYTKFPVNREDTIKKSRESYYRLMDAYVASQRLKFILMHGLDAGK